MYSMITCTSKRLHIGKKTGPKASVETKTKASLRLRKLKKCKSSWTKSYGFMPKRDCQPETAAAKVRRPNIRACLTTASEHWNYIHPTHTSRSRVDPESVWLVRCWGHAKTYDTSRYVHALKRPHLRPYFCNDCRPPAVSRILDLPYSTLGYPRH